ncbi:MAG: hypothetical protein ACRDT4_05630 [Micromonosporaceae bacterium]
MSANDEADAASDDALLDRQAARQAAARAVLNVLQPLQRWRRFGEPSLCGAMAYRLLVAPDIDIEIFGPLDPVSGFHLASAWAGDPAVRRVLFINAIGEADAGLGWEVSYLHRGVAWAVQMWLLPEDYDGPRSVDLVMPMRAALDRASRCAILRIKEELVARGTGHRSIDLYRAVLDHGVDTVEEYDRWCRSHSSTGMVNWRPAGRP